MKPHPTRQWAGKVLLLIWATLCTILFITIPGKVSYIQWSDLGEWHRFPEKLARLDLARDLANLLRSLVGVIAFSVACTSLGIFITKKIRIDNSANLRTVFTRLALLSTEFLIGHGLFSLIFLTLSGLYQLTPIYVILILSAGFLLGSRYIRNDFLDAFMDVKSNFKESLEGRWENIPFWFSSSILIFSLLYSSARISYDSTAIYFSNAKLTAMAHHVQFFLDNTFVVSAFQTGIQYTALILIIGDQSARMLSWIFGIVIIIFSLALGERLGISKRAKPFLLAMLLTSTAFLDLMGDGKVDLMSSAPAIASIYWMVVESEGKESNKSLLLVIGLMSGLAIVARPFNAVLLGIFVVLFYLQRLYIKNNDFRPMNYKLFASSMFWIGIGILALGIYHLFANWMILGDSLAFLSNASRFAKLDPAIGPWDYYPDQFLVIRLLYPFVATFRNSPPSLGNITPLFVAFLPALFIQEIRKEIKLSKHLTILLVISIITLLLWIFSLFTVFEIRYVLFLWAILFIPVAEIIANTLENKDRVLRYVLRTLLIILLAFMLIRTIFISVDKYSPIDRQGNPQCFCDSIDPINAVAGPGDRVLTLNAYRYYLRSDLFACSTKHDEYNKLYTVSLQSNDAFWREVYRQGYKYLSFEYEYTTRHLQMGIIPSPANTPQWLELEPIYSGPENLHMAYRIHIITSPGGSQSACEMNTNGIWEVRSIK